MNCSSEQKPLDFKNYKTNTQPKSTGFSENLSGMDTRSTLSIEESIKLKKVNN